MGLRFYTASPVAGPQVDATPGNLSVQIMSLSKEEAYEQYNKFLAADGDKANFKKWLDEAKSGEVSWFWPTKRTVFGLIAVETDLKPAETEAQWCRQASPK